jgi:hypothetical protein
MLSISDFMPTACSQNGDYNSFVQSVISSKRDLGVGSLKIGLKVRKEFPIVFKVI